jgi:ABC-type thiamine transport system ATPase subunit
VFIFYKRDLIVTFPQQGSSSITINSKLNNLRKFRLTLHSQALPTARSISVLYQNSDLFNKLVTETNFHICLELRPFYI